MRAPAADPSAGIRYFPGDDPRRYGRAFPPVDERLVEPESRAEMLDGRVLLAMPADEPHGRSHFTLAELLGAHVAPGYVGAVDMLTRTNKKNDFAPDVSIFLEDRDPETGGRRLEELAFEIVSKQRLDVATVKARSLSYRGVRRVFCISLETRKVQEWRIAIDDWQPLDDDEVIDDPCLVPPLPVRALLDTTSIDEAVARALLAKGTPVLQSALAEAERRAVRRTLATVLAARGLPLDAEARARIDACDDLIALERWAARAAVATDLAAALAL